MLALRIKQNQAWYPRLFARFKYKHPLFGNTSSSKPKKSPQTMSTSQHMGKQGSLDKQKQKNQLVRNEDSKY